MDILRIIEFVIVAIGAISTFVVTIWTVSAKLTRHDEKQNARNAIQDLWIKDHEMLNAKTHAGLVELMNQVQGSITKQFVDVNNDIQRLKRRESEMSDQVNKINTLTDEDRKRVDDDRKAIAARLDILATQFHEMDKKLTQVHTIVVIEKNKGRTRP